MADLPRLYRFGSAERGGLLGGLRVSQVLLLGLCTLLAFVGFVALGPSNPSAALGGAILIAIVALGGAFAPVGGQAPVDWLPVLVTFAARRKRWRSAAPGKGTVSDTAPLELPSQLRGIDVLAAPVRDSEVAVIANRRTGTYTGVLAVRVSAFGLLDRDEQERRLERWGMVLASLSREGSPVGRIQWVERSVPSDGDEMGRYLAEARDQSVPITGRSIASYVELVDSAGLVTQDHELFLAVRVDAAKASRAIKRMGGGDEGACAVLLRECELLSERLSSAHIGVRGLLRPNTLAKVLRTAFDPFSRVALARAEAQRTEAQRAERDGVPLAASGPLAADETWSLYRTDAACHATLWISAWPRIEVPAPWMMPMLTQAGVVRTISLVMEPISLVRATREAEAARTSDLESEQLRREHGFVTRARQRREQEANVRREAELSRGHSELRYSGYVTVSARDAQALELAVERVEHAATQAHLEVRRLYGEQARSFSYTLPLGEGLA